MKYFNSKAGFLNDIDQRVADKSLINIKIPTLIIHSENDNSVPIEHAIHANNMIENSQLEILQNRWGHMIWMGEDSEIATGKIVKFIEE